MSRKTEVIISLLLIVAAWIVDPWTMHGELHAGVWRLLSNLNLAIFRTTQLLWSHPFLNVTGLISLSLFLDWLRNAEGSGDLKRHWNAAWDSIQGADEEWTARRQRSSHSSHSGSGAHQDRKSAGSARNPRSWWEVLEVDPVATEKAIKAAYRAKAKTTHPDSLQGSADAFREVREAYDAARKQRGMK